jgi:hypothetical protein
MALDGWVVSTSAAKGARGVRVGEAWVPSRFTVWAEKDYGDIDVELQCSTDNGRSVDVRECHVRVVAPHDRITTSLLRQVPVGTLGRLGMWAAAMRRDAAERWERVIPEEMRQRWSDVTVWQTDPPDEDEPRTTIRVTDLDPEWLARLEKDHVKLIEARRGVGVRTDEWWRKIEEAYLDAIERREHTGTAVAEAMNLELQSAKNAITKARKLGYNLPKRGRVK